MRRKRSEQVCPFPAGIESEAEIDAAFDIERPVTLSELRAELSKHHERVIGHAKNGARQMRLKDAAKVFGCSKRTLENAARRGELRVKKLGHGPTSPMMVSVEDVERLASRGFEFIV